MRRLGAPLAARVLLAALAAASPRAARGQDRAVPVPSAPSPSGLTLEQAYARVLATDEGLGIALVKEREARLLPWTALARMGPSLTAGAAYVKPKRELLSPFGFPILAEGNSESVTIQQPLLDPAAFFAVRGGRLAARRAALERRLATRAVLFGVARAYYDVLKRERVTAIEEQTLALARQQLEVADKRFEVGEVTRTDVLRARVSVSRAERAVTEARDDLRLARTLLNDLLNDAPDRGWSVCEPEPAASSALTLEESVALAHARREDLRAADLVVDETVEKRRELAAGYAPRVIGQWNYGWLSPELLSQRNDFWTASVAMQLPLFAGGQRELDLSRARDEIESARLGRDGARKAVDRDVTNAWLRAHTLEGAVASLKHEVASAEENYDDISHRYRVAEATSLDVDSALTELNAARTALASQSYDHQVALRGLELATGTFEEPRVNEGARR